MQKGYLNFFKMAAGLSQLLAGRFTVISGAGSGIGRAVAVLFSKEGSQLALADINLKSCHETLGLVTKDLKHYCHEVDVSKSDSVTNLFESIKKEHSKIPDVVVNCAGITRDGLMVDMTEAQFDEVININLKGTYLMTQIASKYMIQENMTNGSIVNISSISGKIGNFGQCNYAASKAGVESLTKTASKELGKFGIRCNVVMPGFIDTPMVETVPAKVKGMLLKQIPLGRFGTPTEVAEAICFLASDRSSYLTGTTIQISGGFYT